MKGASRWLDANALVEKTERKAAAKMGRMGLLQMGGSGTGSAPYFGRSATAVFFAICALAACRKNEPKTEPNPAEQRAKDVSALPQAGTVDGQLQAESAARLKDADTITLDQLEDVLKGQGITFGPSRQLMARQQLA